MTWQRKTKHSKLLLLTTGLLILLSGLVTASSQHAHYGGEILEFTLLVEELSCESTTTLFRVERLNYTTGMDALDVSYTFILKNNNNPIYNATITKSINKYSAANTGYLPEDSSNATTIQIIVNDQELTWDLPIFCIINGQDGIENNNTGQVPGNQTNINQSGTDSNITPTGPLNETNHTTSPETNETTTECIMATITTDKEMYVAGEQIRMDFSFVPQPPAGYTYWIENVRDTPIKTARETTNTNTKTYTIKHYEAIEMTHVIRVAAEELCEQSADKLYVHTTNPQFTPEEPEEEKKETNICKTTTASCPTTRQFTTKLDNVDLELQQYHGQDVIFVAFDLYKGDTRKSVLQIVAKQNGSAVSKPTNIKLNEAHTHTNIKTHLVMQQDISGTVDVVFEGLDIDENRTIIIKKKEMESTTQVSTTTEQNQGTEAYIIPALTVKAIDNTTGPVAVQSRSDREERRTLLLLSVTTTLLLVGICIGYGPRKAIDRFIKK